MVKKKKKTTVSRVKPVAVKAKVKAKAQVKAKGRAVKSRLKVRSGKIKRRVVKAAPVLVTPPSIRIPRKYRRLYGALGRLRDQIIRQINFLATDNLNRTQNDTEVDFRSEEQGTDNFARDFALNRVSLDQDILFEIDEASNRIQMGTYGVCEICGHSIEQARLTALPYSRMCVTCQSKTETSGRHLQSFGTQDIFPNVDKTTVETAGDDE